MSKEEEVFTKHIQSREEERKQLTIDYVRAILDYELEIKSIKNDMAKITEEAKENMVNIKLAKKAITKMKYLLKTTDEVLTEEESVLGYVQDDTLIIANITELIRKG